MDTRLSVSSRPTGARCAVCLALLFALALAPSAAAGTRLDIAAGLLAQDTTGRQREGISLQQAAAQVQQRTSGRILMAETRRNDGREVHVIRVLTEGRRVRTIQVDARSGAWVE